jgi:hypothetical protein
MAPQGDRHRGCPVVDDNDAYLRAAIDVVDASCGFELVGTASTGEEAVVVAATTARTSS